MRMSASEKRIGLALAVTALVAVVACSSSTVAMPDAGAATDSGTTADGGATTDAAASGNCTFKGTYALEQKLCGTSDVTTQWKTVIPTEALEVTDKEGGGCTMQITHTSPGVCVEVESIDATLVSGSSYSFAFLGITSCSPAACKFTNNDAPCLVGDRVKTETATVVIEGANIRITTPSKAGDICGGMADVNVFAP
jgi:hypothetical protein